MCVDGISGGLGFKYFAKSKFVWLGDRVDRDNLAKIMGCGSVELPIKYLGLPLGANYKCKRCE